MAQVRVWNKNIYPYSEVFEDQKITIPAKSFIEMDEKKAIMFKGTFCAPKLNAQKIPQPESFKMLEIESVSKPLPIETKYICQYDGKEFGSQAELDKYIDENHLDKLTDVKVAEDRKKKMK